MPTKAQIDELKLLHWVVVTVDDTPPPYYRFLNRASGDSQDSSRQPYRRNKDQAWQDCYDYVYGEVPSPARPNWQA